MEGPAVLLVLTPLAPEGTLFRRNWLKLLSLRLRLVWAWGRFDGYDLDIGLDSGFHAVTVDHLTGDLHALVLEIVKLLGLAGVADFDRADGLPVNDSFESTCTVQPVDSAPIAIARWSVPTSVTFCGSLSSACKQTQPSVRSNTILTRAMRIADLLFSPKKILYYAPRIENGSQYMALPQARRRSHLFPVTPDRIGKRAISRDIPHGKPRPRPPGCIDQPRVLVIVECRRRLQVDDLPVGVHAVAPHHLAILKGNVADILALTRMLQIALRGH